MSEKWWHKVRVLGHDGGKLRPSEVRFEPLANSLELSGVQRTKWVDISGAGVILGGETHQRLINIVVSDHEQVPTIVFQWNQLSHQVRKDHSESSSEILENDILLQ